MVSANPARPAPRNQWAVSYNQNDVDMIREQIEQNEAAKRRWLFLALVVTIAALVGAVILVSSSYALYSKGETEKRQLSDENAALKTASDQYQQQLKVATAAQEREANERADAQAKLGTLMPAVLRSSASDSDTGAFARMVYNMPHGRVEIEQQPPNKLFRNWRYNSAEGMETYTLVGGFVDGKWVIHSNLVARK